MKLDLRCLGEVHVARQNPPLPARRLFILSKGLSLASKPPLQFVP